MGSNGVPVWAAKTCRQSAVPPLKSIAPAQKPSPTCLLALPQAPPLHAKNLEEGVPLSVGHEVR
jgi:hypothetical protein